jgi:hypothetical protein
MIRKHFRFKRLILGLAVVFAIAAVTAPALPAMHVDSATGGTQASSEKYGPLDPWAYAVIHQSTQATLPSAGKYGPLDPWAYAVIHQSKQANVVPAGNYGPLDPWAYAVIHRSSPSVVTARSDNGFNYSDAGIGASVFFGAALLLLTAVALGRRYRSRFDRSGLATS